MTLRKKSLTEIIGREMKNYLREMRVERVKNGRDVKDLNGTADNQPCANDIYEIIVAFHKWHKH